MYFATSTNSDVTPGGSDQSAVTSPPVAPTVLSVGGLAAAGWDTSASAMVVPAERRERVAVPC